jgi:hypothetical protein
MAGQGGLIRNGERYSRFRSQAVAQGVRCRLGTVRGTSLGENIADMCGYCIEADVQRLGNITVALASGEEAQHLHLALRQVIEGRGGGWGDICARISLAFPH